MLKLKYVMKSCDVKTFNEGSEKLAIAFTLEEEKKTNKSKKKMLNKLELRGVLKMDLVKAKQLH